MRRHCRRCWTVSAPLLPSLLIGGPEAEARDIYRSEEQSAGDNILRSMAEIISLAEGRVQHLREMPRCDKCKGRLSFVEQVAPVRGKIWNVYRCRQCKGIQWKLAKPEGEKIW
jgi:hypothetical protein